MLFIHNCSSNKAAPTGNLRIIQAVSLLLSIILIFSAMSFCGFHASVSAQDSSTTGSSEAPAASDITPSDLSPTPADSSSSTAAPADAASADGLTTLLDPEGVGAPEIDGKAYILYDVTSGSFLIGKNQDTPLAPASITKVMTILLTFEKLKMTDTITVTRDMYESIPESYVRLGLVEGEVITVEEAVYACLLISSNDAAMALAITMGGSVEGFSKMMNERAVELGCLHTNFTNPYGLSDEKHLTTAHDMALMMAEALKNDMYSKISTTANYTFPATNKHDQRSITNGNRFVSTTTYAYENYIGGKTGNTDMAGYTIVAGARQNNRTLIGVVLGASVSVVRYSDIISLFTYGFEQFSTSSVDPEEYADIQKQTVDQVTAGITGAGYALEITDVALNMKPYCTTTAAKSAGGYSTGIDLTKAVIRADLPTQILVFPLYRLYSDTTKEEVGTLKITISDPKKATTVSTGTAESAKPKTSLFATVVRAGIVFLLLCILAFCITIYVMLQKEKKRRRNRRKPRVL